MLSEDTADCQPLVNTALFLRLIKELVERGVVARPGPYCKCRERSASLPGAERAHRRRPDPQRIDAEALGTGINRLMWLQPPGWEILPLSPRICVNSGAIFWLQPFENRYNSALAIASRGLPFSCLCTGAKSCS